MIYPQPRLLTLPFVLHALIMQEREHGNCIDKKDNYMINVSVVCKHLISFFLALLCRPQISFQCLKRLEELTIVASEIAVIIIPFMPSLSRIYTSNCHKNFGRCFLLLFIHLLIQFLFPFSNDYMQNKLCIYILQVFSFDVVQFLIAPMFLVI